MWLWLRRQLILLLAWGRPVLCNCRIEATVQERADGSHYFQRAHFLLSADAITSQNTFEQTPWRPMSAKEFALLYQGRWPEDM